MSRKDTSVVAIISGYQVTNKVKGGSILFHSPMGVNFSLTIKFMEEFLSMYDTNEEFQRNFTTKEINPLPQENSLGRPDRTSIGFVEGYEIIKNPKGEMENVFLRSPMGAFCGFPINVIRESLDLYKNPEYNAMFN